MLISTLFKFIDHRNIVICGHLDKHEIASLKAEGWRFEKPNTNKNDIPVQTNRRKHS